MYDPDLIEIIRSVRDLKHLIKKQKFIDGTISAVCILGAIIVGRFAGFLGIGAIALGWVAYNFSKDKVGTFLGILIGAVAGLAAYGFAAVALLDMLG